MDNRPIGLFDSGIGGLTVLKEYLNILPNENYIYYGDTAHLPYGDKSKEKIIEYADEIVKFLISKNVKMIIIACGTASANAYEFLKDKYKNIEIRNIIEPVAKNISDDSIGIIATKATIKSKAWENAVQKFNSEVTVHSLACPLFVPLIEEGFSNHISCDLIVKEYLKFFNDKNISSVILGCTHYPILKDKIQNAIGNNIKLIDAGIFSAKDTFDYLKNNNLLNNNDYVGKVEYFSSDNFDCFKENAKNLNFIIN